jgi:hypothetical protein
MTAVMRAVSPTGPKVLRIGVVVGGRVMEERIIKDRVDVTIGPNERSMFVLSPEYIRSSHKLFQLASEGYYLNFLDKMTGRVALPTGVSDLDVLKGQAKKGPSGSYQIRLTEDSRGKVLVGDVLVALSDAGELVFVAAEPAAYRELARADVLAGKCWSTPAFSDGALYLRSTREAVKVDLSGRGE